MGALHPHRRAGQGGGRRHPDPAGRRRRRSGRVFTAAAEAADGAHRPDGPLVGAGDRGLATGLGARRAFPLWRAAHTPFIDWALKSGRAFSSPTGMLVHDTVGLMISYRGALHFAQEFDLPRRRAASPCADCAGPTLPHRLPGRGTGRRRAL